MPHIPRYQEISDLPKHLPLFPLAGALLLPRVDLPLNVFEPRYLAMVEDAMASHRMISMIQPLDGEVDANPKLQAIGCAGRITAYSESEGGRLMITITGVCRFTLEEEEAQTHKAYRQASVDYDKFAGDLVSETGSSSVNRRELVAAFRSYLEANSMTANWHEVEEVSTEILVNTLSLLAPYPPRDKQALLEAPDLKSRAEVLVALTELQLSRSGNNTRQRMQ
jgi:Lon protease-like protein